MNMAQQLLEQMGEIDPKTVDFGNEGPKEGQTVVGALSEDARRIWGVLIQINDQYNRLYDEFQKEKPGSDRYKELDLQLETTHLRVETITNIFWTTVKLEFPELCKKHHYGVCQNGQVYWEPCNCRSRTVGFEIITVGPGGFSSLFKG